jgi:hypothetical protein
MPKTFRIDSAQKPSTLVARAERAAIGNNAAFRGDETSGSFSGSGFKGTYGMDGKTVTVTIIQKPFYAPWPMVESELERLLV